MRKNIITIFLIISLTLLPQVFADSWDDYADIDRAWDGQKSITNKEFEQVMDSLQQKQKKKEARKKKRAARKISGGGTSLHDELNPDKNINEITPFKEKEEGLLLNVPVNLYVDGKYLDKGFYKILADKDNNGKIYLKFYQSQYYMGKVEANETEDDFNEENVDFIKLTEYNGNLVKIIYGCIDFNAFVYVPYSE